MSNPNTTVGFTEAYYFMMMNHSRMKASMLVLDELKKEPESQLTLTQLRQELDYREQRSTILSDLGPLTREWDRRHR